MPGPLDLTGQKLRLTFQRVVQYQSGNFFDGLGNQLSFGGVTVNGENYLSLSSQVITAHPINLASSNVTGRLPFSNITQLPAQLLLGNPTGATGNITSVSIGDGLQFSGTSLQINLSYLSSRRIYNETPSGVQDGTNNNFSTLNTFISNSTRVFFNGQRLKLGPTFDYIETLNSGIQISFAPTSSDVLIIDYDI